MGAPAGAAGAPAMGIVLYWASFPLLSFMEIIAAEALFAFGQPRRESFAWRLIAVLAATLCLALAAGFVLAQSDDAAALLSGSPAGYSPGVTIFAQTLLFGLYLVATVPALMLCFELGAWGALFCATAGYALQNLGSGLCETAIVALRTQGIEVAPTLMGVLSFASCALVYLALYPALIRPASRINLESASSRGFLVMLLAIIIAVIGFDVVLKSPALRAVDVHVLLALRIFHLIVCLFALMIELEIVARRQLALEVETTERLAAERERQLQMSRENIDAINIKCHDLRHQIRQLAEGGAAVDGAVLDDLAREVRMYDLAVRTGNDALDTILTEKSLLCEQRSITLTCLADGAALSFMAPADLYALFGNALDNAIEAVADLGDARRRSISLIVRERAGMVSVHVENYYAGASSVMTSEEGCLKSTKADAAAHGFGTRSMRAIVERYGGTLTFSAGDQTFSLDAMFPVA